MGLTESIRPGVNDKYLEADALKTFTEIFEGERREVVEFKPKILAALKLAPGMRVADVGAGTGLFTFDIAEAVGDGGKVYAVDISPVFLEGLRSEANERKANNVEVHEATPKDIGLAAGSVDLALMCDVYHHVEYPFAYMPTLARALGADGELILIDFERIEGTTSPRMLKHVRADKQTVIAELERAGFRVVEELDLGFEENYALRLKVR